MSLTPEQVAKATGKPAANVAKVWPLVVLELAQRDGRPVAIVRLGGRTPDLARPEPGFYGDPAPIAVVPEVIGPQPAADFPEVLP